MELKIGRKTYTITNIDEFLDNGNCVKLMTQSKEPSDGCGRSRPVLSKRAIKEIGSFKRVPIAHIWGGRIKVFTLDI